MSFASRYCSGVLHCTEHDPIYLILSEKFCFTIVKIRAVVVIDVSIEKSCDIHIDTEMWISILIVMGSTKQE